MVKLVQRWFRKTSLRNKNTVGLKCALTSWNDFLNNPTYLQDYHLSLDFPVWLWKQTSIDALEDKNEKSWNEQVEIERQWVLFSISRVLPWHSGCLTVKLSIRNTPKDVLIKLKGKGKQEWFVHSASEQRASWRCPIHEVVSD